MKMELDYRYWLEECYGALSARFAEDLTYPLVFYSNEIFKLLYGHS